MASNEEKTRTEGESTEGDDTELVLRADAGDSTEVEFDGAAGHLGTERYVHAAFLAAGVLIAYLSGQILATIWNALAEWPAAVRAVPQLLSYAEDERPSFTMIAGALVGVLTVVYFARQRDVRQWADEVASELYKVHWPDRETVTNGTVVVIVAGVFATLYVGLLDRLWGFITNLVYGI
jgi:preprotein translocase subunit SecE